MIWRGTTLAMIGVLGGWLGYLAADRDIPLTILSMEAVPQKTASRTIQFRYKAVRTKLCDVSVSRFIYDAADVRYSLPNFSYPAHLNNLGTEEYTTQTQLPLGVVEGPAIYRTVNCYVCNITHKISPTCGPPRDIPFTITKQMAELP